MVVVKVNNGDETNEFGVVTAGELLPVLSTIYGQGALKDARGRFLTMGYGDLEDGATYTWLPAGDKIFSSVPPCMTVICLGPCASFPPISLRWPFS